MSGALQQTLQVVPGLVVDSARMRQNLELSNGLVLAEAVSIALALRIGRDAAHHLLEQCCRRAVEQGEPFHLAEAVWEEMDKLS